QWVVQLTAASGLQDLTVTDSQVVEGFRGLVGGGGEGMTISGCELMPRGGYAVLIASPQARRFRMNNNILHGSMRIFWHGVSRAEIVGNTILRGGFGGRPISESVFANNILRDAPGRSAFDSTRRSLFELNEVHGFWYGPYPEHNWEEAMMSHGGDDKIIGFPTGCAESSLTEGGRSWKPGEHRGKTVLIMEGRGFGQYRHVMDNTADTLILEKPWRVRPDQKSRYALGTYYVENIHRKNLVDGWGVYVLWLDQINNRVEALQTAAAGCVLWGRDGAMAEAEGKIRNPGSYNPSWYNIISGAALEGGNVSIETDDSATPAYKGPVLFANMIANNRITAPHLRRMSQVRGMEQRTHYQGPGSLISSHAGVALTDLNFLDTPGTRRRATHTNISGNYFVEAPYAVELQDVAGKTFILNNQFQFVKNPLLAGEETMKLVFSASNTSFAAEEVALQRRVL
ncbi:MAG: hypothetical protein Q8O57_10940, partial [Kiritimatiellota bacterium]|nr:hypothetical protein [Kiritimatiellota bacterium]